MAKWRIPVNWKVYGEFEIEANTVEEAIKRAYKQELPEVIMPVDDSLEIFETHIERISPDKVNPNKDDKEKWPDAI